MYDQDINRARPGCIVILLDRSDSMQTTWDDTGMSLAEGATQAVNKILFELRAKGTKEYGGLPRHYFDIGVFGYGECPGKGGAEGVESAFGGELAGHGLVSLPVLAAHPLALVEHRSVDAVASTARLPIWVEPVAGQRTPMCEAIAVAGSHIYDWANAHPDSFPPIVINITDGLVTDEPYSGADLASWAQRLTSIVTNDGPTLLLNIFLSPESSQAVEFPATAAHLPSPGPELFAISSLLPPTMLANARKSMPVADGARGFCFNAGLPTLVKFLEIGTRVGDVRL